MTTYGYVRAPVAPAKLPSVDKQNAAIIAFAQTHALGSVALVTEEPDAMPDEIFGPAARARLLSALSPGDVIIGHSFACLFIGPADASFVLRLLQYAEARVFLVEPEWEITAEGELERFCALMDSIKAAIGEERGRPIREAKRRRKRSAVYLGGGVPFGFRKTRIGDIEGLEPDPDQQRAITRALDLRGRGWSYQRIARDLQVAGHQISHVTVSRILKAATDTP